MPKVTTLCEQCGIEMVYFSSSYPPNGIKRFCGRDCQKKAARVWTTCPTCGLFFWYHRCWKRIYCSAKCAGTANITNINRFTPNPPVIANCLACQKPFKIRAAKAVKAKVKFCSQKCHGIYHAAPQETQHSDWQGGYQNYYGSTWHTQRTLARKRDNHTCQQCGAKETEGKFHTHHLTPIQEFDDLKLANALSNLVLLCPLCHRRTHRDAELSR